MCLFAKRASWMERAASKTGRSVSEARSASEDSGRAPERLLLDCSSVSRMSRGPAPVFSGPVPGERRKPKPVNVMHLKSAGKIIRFSNKLYCGCANSSTCAQNLALLRIPAFSGPGTGPEKTGAGSRDILLTLLQSSNNLSGARPLSSLALRASLTQAKPSRLPISRIHFLAAIPPPSTPVKLAG